jgi:hypothetical protein
MLRAGPPVYVPITQDGKVVDSQGYLFGPDDE